LRGVDEDCNRQGRFVADFLQEQQPLGERFNEWL
jgi:hypothetical protein